MHSPDVTQFHTVVPLLCDPHPHQAILPAMRLPKSGAMQLGLTFECKDTPDERPLLLCDHFSLAEELSGHAHKRETTIINILLHTSCAPWGHVPIC